MTTERPPSARELAHAALRCKGKALYYRPEYDDDPSGGPFEERDHCRPCDDLTAAIEACTVMVTVDAVDGRPLPEPLQVVLTQKMFDELSANVGKRDAAHAAEVALLREALDAANAKLAALYQPTITPAVPPRPACGVCGRPLVRYCNGEENAVEGWIQCRKNRNPAATCGDDAPGRVKYMCPDCPPLRPSGTTTGMLSKARTGVSCAEFETPHPPGVDCGAPGCPFQTGGK